MSTRRKTRSRIREVEKDTNTAMNDYVTDSVVQADEEVVGVSSASSVGNLFQSNSQSLSLAVLNATNAQQQNTLSAQASATMGLTNLFSIDIATGTVGTANILSEALKK